MEDGDGSCVSRELCCCCGLPASRSIKCVSIAGQACDGVISGCDVGKLEPTALHVPALPMESFNRTPAAAGPNYRKNGRVWIVAMGRITAAARSVNSIISDVDAESHFISSCTGGRRNLNTTASRDTGLLLLLYTRFLADVDDQEGWISRRNWRCCFYNRRVIGSTTATEDWTRRGACSTGKKRKSSGQIISIPCEPVECATLNIQIQINGGTEVTTYYSTLRICDTELAPGHFRMETVRQRDVWMLFQLPKRVWISHLIR